MTPPADAPFWMYPVAGQALARNFGFIALAFLPLYAVALAVGAPTVWGDALLIGVGLAVNTVVAHAVHRHVLLGERFGARDLLRRRGWPSRGFVGLCVLLHLCFAPAYVLLYADRAWLEAPDTLGGPVVALTLLGLAVAGAGMMLFGTLFPAAAEGAPIEPGAARRRMRGQYGRLLAGFLIGPFIVGALLRQLRQAVEQSGKPFTLYGWDGAFQPEVLPVHVIFDLFVALQICLGVVVLCDLYRAGDEGIAARRPHW